MPVQYGRKCFVCNNTRHRSKQCRLFRFPIRGSTMWCKWLTALGLTDVDIDIHSNEPPRLCQRHFEPKDFLTRKLSGMAVPMHHVQNAGKEKISTDVGAMVRLNSEDERHKKEEHTDIQMEATIERYSHSTTIHNHFEEFPNRQDSVETETYGYESCYSPLPDVIEEETNTASVPTRSCDVPEHQALTRDLELERLQVEHLLTENARQRHIVEVQQNLLMQLGVQCTILDEDSYSQPDNEHNS